jgi:hypothetical protein
MDSGNELFSNAPHYLTYYAIISADMDNETGEVDRNQKHHAGRVVDFEIVNSTGFSKITQLTEEIWQMMFVSGETGEPSAETTTLIEGIVQGQVIEMVRDTTST